MLWLGFARRRHYIHHAVIFELLPHSTRINVLHRREPEALRTRTSKVESLREVLEIISIFGGAHLVTSEEVRLVKRKVLHKNARIRCVWAPICALNLSYSLRCLLLNLGDCLCKAVFRDDRRVFDLSNWYHLAVDDRPRSILPDNGLRY